MGLLDRFRRRTVSGSRHAALAHLEVLGDDVRWTQPFHWGLLIAHDDGAAWEVPSGAGKGSVAANTSCLAVPVRHSQDVTLVDDDDDDVQAPPPQARVAVVLTTRPLDEVPDYEGVFQCPTGQLRVGDADEYRLVQVPPGRLRVQVWLEPEERADRVFIALQRVG